jgi:hypothetical protein
LALANQPDGDVDSNCAQQPGDPMNAAVRRMKAALVLAALAVSLASQGQSSLPVRVALVSSCTGGVAENELALATAALSKEPGVTLVERSEVERVLQEQHLQRCGLSDPRQAVATGKILGVEVFATVESYGVSNQTLGFVIFDAGTGAKLWDAFLPGRNANETAAGIVTMVREACAKRRPSGSPSRTVCLLTVRNLGLPREWDSACDAAGRMLERRLLNSPDVTVLERRRLEQINLERTLPGATAASLQSSLVLLELEVARVDHTNRLKGTVFLTDSAGKVLNQVEATLSTSVPGDLVEALLPGVLKALKAASPSGGRDLNNEAQRFFSESQFLWSDGDHAGALQMAEAAAALDDISARIQIQLAKCLADRANELLKTSDVRSSLPFAERALELCRRVRVAAAAPGKTLDPDLPAVEDLLSTKVSLYPGKGYWDQCIALFQKQDAETRSQLLAFQHQLRELVMQWELQRWRSSVTNRATMREYASQMDFLLANAEKLAPSSEVWTADLMVMMSGWLDVFWQYRLGWGGWSLEYSRPMARLACQANGCARKGPRPLDWELQPRDVERFGELFQRMETHKDPIIQCYGRIGKVGLAWRGQTNLNHASLPEYQAAKEFIREKLDYLRHGAANDYHMLAYTAARDLIDIVPDAKFRRQEHRELFEFMMERRDVSYWTASMVIDPMAWRFGQYHFYPATFPFELVGYQQQEYPELLANADRVLNLYNSTNRQDVDATTYSFATGSFEREVAGMRKWIYDRRPELAPAALEKPWTKATTLFAVQGSGWYGLIRSVVVVRDSAFVLLFQPLNGSNSATCLQVPLDGAPPRRLGDVRLGKSNVDQLLEVVVADHVLYVGDRTLGIYGLPLDGGPIRKINQDSGLLSSHVDAFTVANGKIYAMLNEGHFVAYDLKSNRCETLASKRSREKRSPLDDISPGFEILTLISDPARHRVLFTTRFNERKNCFPPIGLWQIDTETHRIKQLLELYYPPRWAALNDPDHLLLECLRNETESSCTPPFDSVLSYDLASDSTRVLWTFQKGRSVGPTLPGDPRTIRREMFTSPPYLLVDDWLWLVCRGHARLSLSTGENKEFLPPDKVQDAGRPWWHHLHQLNDGKQILAADDGHLWLLTLAHK